MQTTEKTTPTILVLAAAPGRYNEFERFISRRGWNVRFHTDMRTFLTDVIALQPQFALMSVDTGLPTEYARNLAVKVYKLKVIDFAEEQTLASWQRLRDSKGDYQIYGLLTGPAFERALVHLNSRANEDATGVVAADAFLKEGVSQIFRAHLNRGEGVIKKPLGWTSEVLCVQVKSPLVKGHFVIAAANERLLRTDLLAVMRDALVRLVREVGGDPDTLQSFPLEIRRVEFKKWAESEASFIEAGPHDGTEVALAFFPAAAEIFHFEPAKDTEHFAISLDEVRPDRKVDYNLFVHLPLNGKYVLYVSRGGMLNLHQQLNLQAKGLRSFHVEKDDLAKVLQDRAARNLDGMIASFYETRAAA